MYFSIRSEIYHSQCLYKKLNIFSKIMIASTNRWSQITINILLEDLNLCHGFETFNKLCVEYPTEGSIVLPNKVPIFYTESVNICHHLFILLVLK